MAVGACGAFHRGERVAGVGGVPQDPRGGLQGVEVDAHANAGNTNTPLQES